MESMTGFSQVKKEKLDFSASVQIRSVNSRYLDIKCNLPPELYFMESKIRESIQKKFKRGTFDVYLSYLNSDLNSTLSAMKDWVKKYQEAAAKLGVEDDLTLSKVLKHSKSLGVKNLSAAKEKDLYRIIEEALKKIKEERLKEGRALKKVLSEELKVLKRELQALKKVAKANIKKIKMEGRKKIKKSQSASGSDLEKERMESDLVAALEKSDITEELKRLEIHIGEFGNLLQSKTEALGKKLDFFCQELYRESNTVSSKSKDSELTRLSVNLKSSIEKLRQQVQNIQ